MPKVTKNYNPSFTSKRSNNEIIRLKSKGDSFTFRLADYPNYYGQHWLENDRKFVTCPRVNSKDLNNPDFCGYCEDYAKDTKNNASLKPKVVFVFPALDRKNHKAVFFESTQSVWTEIVNAEKKGINIFKYDWLVERTENKPKYYEVTRLEADELTTADGKALDEAKAMDTEALVKFRLDRNKPEQIEEPQTLEDVIAEMPGDGEMPF